MDVIINKLNLKKEIEIQLINAINDPNNKIETILIKYLENIKDYMDIVNATKIFIILLKFNNNIILILKNFYKNSISLLDKINILNENEIIEILYLIYSIIKNVPDMFNYEWNLLFQFIYNENNDIKWFTLHILSIIFQINDKKLLFKNFKLLEKPNYKSDIDDLIIKSIKNKPYYINSDELNNEIKENNINEKLNPESSIINIYGIILPYKRNNIITNNIPFIHTSTSIYNLQQIAIGLSMNNPLLVTGSSGCGKTSIIREIAKLTGNNDMIEIHLDDQVDSKVLLGTYVCTDIPGEFKWKPGALTQAVIDGKWVLIENIDQAPFDIITAIVPLLENRKLPLSSRDIILDAHPGFQIFATQSKNNNLATTMNQILSNHFTIINLQNLCYKELNHIITETMNIDEKISNRMVKTFSILCSIGVASGMELNNDIEIEIEDEKTKNIWKDAYKRCGRYLSLRDLLKWCKRVAPLFYSNKSSYLTEKTRLSVVLEAVHVFCSCLPDIDIRISIGEIIAKDWSIPENSIKHFFEDYKPQLKKTQDIINIGEVFLKSCGAELECRHFTPTKQALRLLEVYFINK